MIESVAGFIKYFDGIRGRTLKYLAVLPPEQIDWSPAEGEMTCGDLIRHVAAAERMFVGVVVDGNWHYLGHGREVAPTLAAAVDHLNAIHAEAMTRLGQADDSLLYRPRPTLADFEVKAWRFLMAMVEHEVHHRSQLAAYMSAMGVVAPQIFGLEVDEVIAQTGQSSDTPA